jgi:hypothetical protein
MDLSCDYKKLLSQFKGFIFSINFRLMLVIVEPIHHYAPFSLVSAEMSKESVVQ